MFGKHLPNHRTLQDAGIYRSGETLLLEIHTGHQGLVIGTDSILNPYTSILKFISTSDVYISSSLLDLTPKAFRRIIQQVRRGLTVGLKPDLFLMDQVVRIYCMIHTSVLLLRPTRFIRLLF